MVRDGDKQRLAARIFAPQGKDANLTGLQIDFAACQTMLPMFGHFEVTAKQMHMIGFVGSAQEDHHAAGLGIQIELKARWIGPSRSSVTPLNIAGTVACAVASRDRFELQQIDEMIALPDLGLPQ